MANAAFPWIDGRASLSARLGQPALRWKQCLVLCLALACAGCGSPSGPPLPPELPPVPVTLATPTEEVLPDQYTDTGMVTSPKVVPIQAQVTGYLQSVDFTDGQRVTTDQPLFVIDPAPYRASLESAKAQMESAQATLLQAESEYEARVKAGAAITKIELDRSRAERNMAQAQLDAASAAVTKAQLDLDFTTLKSPMDGRVSKTNVSKGALITPLGNMVLTTVVSTDPMYVYFHFDERTLLNALEEGKKRGQVKNVSGVKELNLKVLIQLDDPNLPPLEGMLDFVDNQVDPKTGTILARAVVPNPDEFLTDGMYVRITLVGDHAREALLVPDIAIGTSLGQKFVYVVDDQDIAHYRPVQTGRTVGHLREILPSTDPAVGITKSDRIVVNGLARVRDGAKVQPEKSVSAGNPAPPPNGGQPE